MVNRMVNRVVNRVVNRIAGRREDARIPDGAVSGD
jgi:hypothetical protein